MLGTIGDLNDPAKLAGLSQDERLRLVQGMLRYTLMLLGEDVTRAGLLETPGRWARSLFEVTQGLRTQPPNMKTFPSANSEMVVMQDMWFYSMCEHHMVTFFGVAHVGYIPAGRVVGLSKIARLVDYYAARPQIQEEMTTQIADHLVRELEPQGLIVVLEAEHLCMACRGVRKPNTRTQTSAIRGTLDKQEFFSILRR